MTGAGGVGVGEKGPSFTAGPMFSTGQDASDQGGPFNYRSISALAGPGKGAQIDASQGLGHCHQPVTTTYGGIPIWGVGGDALGGLSYTAVIPLFGPPDDAC